MTKKNLKRLKQAFNNSGSITQNMALSKFGCSQQHISKTLAKKLKIRNYKKPKYLKYTEEQIEVVKRQARWLNRVSLNMDFIIDDEHFFPLS